MPTTTTFTYPLTTNPGPPTGFGFATASTLPGENRCSYVLGPHLPFNATTNPYITTDYMENLPVNENREYRPNLVATLPVPPTQRSSVGRLQPWAGYAAPITGLPNGYTSQRAAQTTFVRVQ